MDENYLFLIEDCDNEDLIGLKGLKLNYLIKNGFEVPQTYCIISKAYNYFIDTNSLSKKIKKILHNSQFSLNEKSTQIKKLIINGKIPDEIFNSLSEQTLSKTAWAIRSSSITEDIVTKSITGRYDSYLNITGINNIVEAVKKCWASLWNERAILYRKNNKISHDNIQIAVLIQRMIKTN